MDAYDVAVVGGGPAGLAASIACAQAGARVVLFERRTGELDQACGEGVMPAGVRALEDLGVLACLGSNGRASIAGIRYLQPNGGASLRAGFAPGSTGLGIRRTALIAALRERAEQCGVVTRERAAYREHAADARGVTVRTRDGAVRAQLLVGADGRSSVVRRALGLELRGAPVERLGLRQHFAATAPADVEVHWGDGVEAYVTPVGHDAVGVALLIDRARCHSGDHQQRLYPRLLSRFPSLAARFPQRHAASPVRGSGVLWRRVRATTADRVVLLGDAAGYIDAITGEGLSLAFRSALALRRLLPGALAAGATPSALEPYARAHAAAYRSYEVMTRTLLLGAKWPELRRNVLGALRHAPWLFTTLVRAVGDASPPWTPRRR